MLLNNCPIALVLMVVLKFLIMLVRLLLLKAVRIVLIAFYRNGLALFLSGSSELSSHFYDHDSLSSVSQHVFRNAIVVIVFLTTFKNINSHSNVHKVFINTIHKH